MEKVWNELKKIDAKAGQIQSEATNKAKKLTDLSHQEAEKLIANSKTYAEEEGQLLYDSTIQEANRNSDDQLKANQGAAEKLKAKAEKRMDRASSAVVKAVLEETKP
jgi:vacuolar-type H+-ATPase subunit E/Vma4